MVARLELSKNKFNEESSTNMISETQDAVLSAFEVSPQQHGTTDIEEVA